MFFWYFQWKLGKSDAAGTLAVAETMYLLTISITPSRPRGFFVDVAVSREFGRIQSSLFESTNQKPDRDFVSQSQQRQN